MALQLTQRRAVVEAEDTSTPGVTTSILKRYGAEIGKQDSKLKMAIMDSLGWEGAEISDEEVAAQRLWRSGRAGSIAGGSNEVQLNIITKRVLGLRD